MAGHQRDKWDIRLLTQKSAVMNQMINEILDTDYTDYTVAVYKNNSVIRV